MKLKKFLFFLVIIILLATGTILILNKKSNTTSDVLTANTIDDVTLYYLRSVPGLSRAKSQDLIIPVHMSLQNDNAEIQIKIDTIWCNPDKTYVFYHTEETNKPTYLGGYFRMPNDVESKLLNKNAIGRESEIGILFDNKFYSFTAFDTKMLFNPNTTQEKLRFKPIALNNDSLISYNDLTINLDYDPKKYENIKKEKLDVINETDLFTLDFSHIQYGYHNTILYFNNSNDNQNTIKRIKGCITSIRGEEIKFNSQAIYSDNKYIITIDPFNEIDRVSAICIDYIDYISNDSFISRIDKGTLSFKKGLNSLQIVLADVKGNKAILESVEINNDIVNVQIKFYQDEKSLFGLITELPALNPFNSYDTLNKPNTISVTNDQCLDLLQFKGLKGVIQNNDNSYSILIDREYWDSSDIITIEHKNFICRYKQ